MAELTDTQRTRIDDALVETGCHGFQGDHPDLYAEVALIVREHVTAALDEIEAVVRHWERHPALRRGTAAAEIRRALHRAKEQNR